jgi:hypothetical protein
MSPTAFTIRLDRIDESLRYQVKAGQWWLSWICTLELDDRGRNVVAQSVPKERYAAGEKEPQLGTWREIGGKDKPVATEQGKRFDLSKYRNADAQSGTQAPSQYPPGRESFSPSPQSAAQKRDQGATAPKPDGFEDLEF